MRAVLPIVGMVMVILAQVSTIVVTKAAISEGINKYVIVVYSEILTTLIFLLCSHVIHRSVYIHLPIPVRLEFKVLS